MRLRQFSGASFGTRQLTKVKFLRYPGWIASRDRTAPTRFAGPEIVDTWHCLAENPILGTHAASQVGGENIIVAVRGARSPHAESRPCEPPRTFRIRPLADIRTGIPHR